MTHETLICSLWTFLLRLALRCCSVDASANRSGNPAVNARRPFTLQGLSKRRSLPAGNTESAFYPRPPSSSSSPLPTLSSLWTTDFLFVNNIHLVSILSAYVGFVQHTSKSVSYFFYKVIILKSSFFFQNISTFVLCFLFSFGLIVFKACLTPETLLT